MKTTTPKNINEMWKSLTPKITVKKRRKKYKNNTNARGAVIDKQINFSITSKTLKVRTTTNNKKSIPPKC